MEELRLQAYEAQKQGSAATYVSNHGDRISGVDQGDKIRHHSN